MTVFLAWVTLLAPLGVAVWLCISPKTRASSMAPKLAIASVLLCAVVSFFFWVLNVDNVESSFGWMNLAGGIELGIIIDPLSKLMLLVVGFVGSAIFIFALGYMKGDPSIGRFFAKFALFVFSMLGIVLANNFLMMFIFWELVGASSYLLIGYYHEKPSAVDAAKKAFMTNRVADFGFLLGILMIWNLTGSFSFTGIEDAVAGGALDGDGRSGELAFASFLIFLGAAGKSAQIPFHVWLPDAMEGPTPVSALMHAATMVAAGIYMVVRAFACFGGIGNVDFGWAPGFIAMTGGITALLAATIALVQRDIKKVLAYSTLSQLGYMVMALGAGAYSIAMFHLVTHAFFKGLLFLCAGSVIHGCHHEQDMFKMGGLRKKMPTTFWTFTIGMAALTGIPLLAGFFSKDLIIDALKHEGLVGLQWMATIVAGLTALYMGRAWFLTFFGQYRGHASPHESPKVMTRPLVFLAVGSVVMGALFYWGGGQSFMGKWTDPMGELHMAAGIAIISTLVVAAGFGAAYFFYGKGHERADQARTRFPNGYALLTNNYYIDDFYLWLVQTVQQGVASFCRVFEEKIVVGVLVGYPTRFARWSGDILRGLQQGRLNFYAYCFAGGLTLILLFFMLYPWGGH